MTSTSVGLRSIRLLAIASAVYASGCRSEYSAVGTNFPATYAPFTGIVSEPASTATGGSASQVYVSLPQTAIPIGESATIENDRTGVITSATLVDGGFDPVAIAARAGDTLFVRIRVLGNVWRETFAVVPRTRRPVVLRTDPPPEKREVPRFASMQVVFSEPIDPASLTTATLTLAGNGAAVAGSVQVIPNQTWMARFTPDAPLAPDAPHELHVSEQVRDLNGETLEVGVRVKFTSAPTGIVLRGGRIAFTRWDGSTTAIYSVNPDGTELRRLADGFDPSFSPDGKSIAFWRFNFNGSSGGVYIMNADGSNATRIIAEGYQPTWSPDSRRIAYGCGGICIINVDGTGRTLVTEAARSSLDSQVCIRDSDPAWSPNGSTIAFTRWPDARIPTSGCLPLGAAMSFPFDFWTEVWFIESDGSNLRPLRDADGLAVTSAGWPSWSPDGRRLAFYYTQADHERIDVVNPDGSGRSTVLDRSPVDWEVILGSPDWSPDGNQILFSAGDRWGFAEVSTGRTHFVTPPFTFAPNSLSWSWSRK